MILNKFAHIINPIKVPQTSDLYVAQPITFETMRNAQLFASGKVEVSLFTAQYVEDMSIVPQGFCRTSNLDRSILDFGKFHHIRKLPLLRDILDRVYEVSGNANFLIYTNVDIGLKPHFYLAVNDFIHAGFDAFVINRRTIPSHYKDIEEVPAMLAEPGVAHRGWDCFVFKRELYPNFKLHELCVGASRVGLGLLANMDAYAQRFREFKREHLTFHIGDERYWRNPAFADYDKHNSAQVMHILEEIEEEVGLFARDSIPGRFLYRQRTLGPIYDFWARNVYLPAGIVQAMNRVFRKD